MNTVIDGPRVDQGTTVLDQTILDDVLACHHGDDGAAWKWVMRCCGETTFLCTRHDRRAMARIHGLIGQNRYCKCGTCGREFGFHPPFNDVYLRLPV